MTKRLLRKKMLDLLKEAGILIPNGTEKIIIHIANGEVVKLTAPDRDLLKEEITT
jgi:hypothetical protein